MRLFVSCAAIVLAGCGADQEAIDDAAAQTCAEVRSGIAAFNDRDYTGTVEHFVKAKPYAKRYAELSDDERADELLKAVDYYASLPAKDYRKALASSSRFQRYKKITLGQCETGTSA